MRFPLSLGAAVHVFVLLSAFVTALGHGQAPATCREGESSCFITSQGDVRDADRAYQELHAPVERHALRTAFEEAIFLGIGATWYWLDSEKNSADWDYPSLGARFTKDVLRFDNNTFPINYLWHPFSGAAFYAFPRANGLRTYEALGFALLTSAAWEYGLEFREKVSVNDLIATPLGGATLGEYFARLALYVNRPVRARGVRHKVFGWLFGPSQAMHDFPHAPRATGPADAYGYMADLHHTFELRAGWASADAKLGRHDVAELAFEGRFVSIPSYGQVGRSRRFFHDADFTQMRMRASLASIPLDFDWQADTTFLGYYLQHVDATPDGMLGGSLAFGTGIGYRYRRLRFSGFHDDFSAVHFPGLSLDATVHVGKAVIALSTRITPDFVGASSDALGVLIARDSQLGTKTVAERYGYVYGFGGSGRLEGTLTVQHVRLGARMLLGRYQSTEGIDRNQEELSRDIEATEQMRELEGFLSVSPWAQRALSLELRIFEQRRASEAENVNTSQRLVRYGVGLSAQL